MVIIGHRYSPQNLVEYSVLDYSANSLFVTSLVKLRQYGLHTTVVKTLCRKNLFFMSDIVVFIAKKQLKSFIGFLSNNN